MEIGKLSSEDPSSPARGWGAVDPWGNRYGAGNNANSGPGRYEGNDGDARAPILTPRVSDNMDIDPVYQRSFDLFTDGVDDQGGSTLVMFRVTGGAYAKLRG